MKIIIVGAGISGLSTYLSLRKYLKSSASKHKIAIYEKHQTQFNITCGPASNDVATFEELSSSTAIVGGGLGVSPNGMRLLGELSQDLHDAIANQGAPCERFVFTSSRGWRLSSQSTGDRRVEDGEEVCVATSRHGLWRCLKEAVVKDGGGIEYRKIVNVIIGLEGGKPKIVFDDQSEEEADLVIGADGVRSVVKKGMFGFKGDGKERFAPVYEYATSLI